MVRKLFQCEMDLLRDILRDLPRDLLWAGSMIGLLAGMEALLDGLRLPRLVGPVFKVLVMTALTLAMVVSRERMELKLMRIKALLTFKTKSSGEDWATTIGWLIPRKYRNDIIGDILEDCAELREAGCTERRIKFHVVYQWLIAVITLVPTAVKTSITDILKQVLSPPK